MVEIKQNEREVAEIVTKKLKGLVDKGVENERVHILDFMVDDIPEAVTDEKKAWDNATGCYGITTISTPFDSESLLLLIGYYGGMEEISSITIKTHYDIDWEEVTGLVAQEIRYQISLEIPAVTKFLVKYKED